MFRTGFHNEEDGNGDKDAADDDNVDKAAEPVVERPPEGEPDDVDSGQLEREKDDLRLLHEYFAASLSCSSYVTIDGGISGGDDDKALHVFKSCP